MEDAKSYTERFNIDRIVTAQSGHVPVPIAIVDKPGAEPAEIADGAALWTKPKSEIEAADYTDFYRGIAGQFDEPALTVHYRAEGRHEFTALSFVPGARPFDLFDPHRKGRVKLYVKRVFITDDAEILPRYLRFVRGLVDSADLPLNISREMIQESPLLAAIKKNVLGRVLGDLGKLADSDAEAYGKLWDEFGSVLKEGIYEDHERRDELLALARFRTTASPEPRRTLKDYVAAMKPEPGRDLLHRRRGIGPARSLAQPGRLPRPRHRGAAAVRSGRQPVDQHVATLRRQAIQVGDAGRAGPRQDPAARRQGCAGARSEPRRDRLPRLRQSRARRRRLRRARLRAADRQRGLPGGRRRRRRPIAGKAARRLRPGGVGDASRCWRSTRATAW